MDTFGGNLKKYFALPDYQTIMRGFTKNDDDVIDPQEQVQDPHTTALITFVFYEKNYLRQTLLWFLIFLISYFFCISMYFVLSYFKLFFAPYLFTLFIYKLID